MRSLTNLPHLAAGVFAPGDVEVTFLWALTGTPDPLGPGLATTGVTSTTSSWGIISSMTSSGWNIAEDAGNGNAEADVATHASGIVIGGFSYNNASGFELANTIGGDTYEIIVIGWDNLTGATTLEDGMAEDVPVGWSNEFEYSTGATITTPIPLFSSSGMNQFGVAPVPEPATLALAGLGGLSLLLIRRRKS
jgi:hypothetical protein